jgi:hypothetical protein
MALRWELRWMFMHLRLTTSGDLPILSLRIILPTDILST